jgi:hypothetical protein
MLPPQSGQTRFRMAEIKLEVEFVSSASEVIVSSLFWRFFTAE